MPSSILFAALYYFLFLIAEIRAFFQILVYPFVWDKTGHGISTYNNVKDLD